MTKFDNGENNFEFETTGLECLHSRVSLSKAHKMSTSSIQEYSNPNHGNHIFGDEDETKKNIELAGLTRVYSCSEDMI